MGQEHVLLPPLRDIVALPVTASTPPQVCAAAGRQRAADSQRNEGSAAQPAPAHAALRRMNDPARYSASIDTIHAGGRDHNRAAQLDPVNGSAP